MGHCCGPAGLRSAWRQSRVLRCAPCGRIRYPPSDARAGVRSSRTPRCRCSAGGVGGASRRLGGAAHHGGLPGLRAGDADGWWWFRCCLRRSPGFVEASSPANRTARQATQQCPRLHAVRRLHRLSFWWSSTSFLFSRSSTRTATSIRPSIRASLRWRATVPGSGTGRR